MQEYNNKKEDGTLRYIYSGEKLDIYGELYDNEGEKVSFESGDILTFIIRNINGVVFFEFCNEPTEKQSSITIEENTFSAKLTSEMTSKMVGLFIIETRLKTSSNVMIDVSKPFEVRNDFIKRT